MNNTKQEAFKQALKDEMLRATRDNPDFAAGFSQFFETMKTKERARKSPSLSLEVVDVAKACNSPEKQTVLNQWIKETSDKNAVDEKGNTVAHLASLGGNAKLLLWFAKRGVRLNADNHVGDNPLHIAVMRAGECIGQGKSRARYLAVIEACLQSRVPNLSADDPLMPKSALGNACLLGDLEVVQLLERHGVDLTEGGIMTPEQWILGSEHRNDELLSYLRAANQSNSL